MTGSFIVNVADALTVEHPTAGTTVLFDYPDGFPDLGINIRILEPGQSNALYHCENQQEDFLVLGGRCVAILDGEERALRAWDFVHCPPGSHHVFIGAGDGPCWILMVGDRKGEENEEFEYPVNELAAKHGASARETTTQPDVAYAERDSAGGEWRPTKDAPWPPEA
jgi:uncharacterized cupin superfamily protein